MLSSGATWYVLCSLEWVEMQRWGRSMQCVVAVMVVYV